MVLQQILSSLRNRGKIKPQLPSANTTAHGGHREVDLAMLALFGGPGGSGSRFAAAYAEAWPLADGHAERVALWQLFPLLVHAVLFGGSYGASAARAAARYA
ncbi:fructosamine kinase family protein [Nitrosomonas communis]|uniref:fructosamine kinase family protein n=1 Tax=Nitrosomonas communis TaxID=44574 RepID=UPI003D2E7B5A